MKAITNFKYIILCLILFGIFANWAQNRYGLIICRYSLLALVVIFLTESIKQGRSKLKNIVFCVFGISIFSVIFFAIMNIEIITIISGILLLIIWLFQFIYPFVNFNKKYKVDHDAKFAASEAFMIFIFVLGFLFKQMHWPVASILLVSGSFGILVLYVLKIIRTLRKEKELPAIFKITRTTVLLWIAIGYFGSFAFKMQHWPGSYIIILFGLVLLVSSIILLLIFRKPVFIANQKTNPLKNLWNVTGNIKVLIIVAFLGYIHYFASIAGISPKFYTLSEPPVYEKMIEKKQEKKASDYRDAFNDFAMKWNSLLK